MSNHFFDFAKQYTHIYIYIYIYWRRLRRVIAAPPHKLPLHNPSENSLKFPSCAKWFLLELNLLLYHTLWFKNTEKRGPKERKRERETERKRESQKARKREREKERKREKEKERKTERQKERKRERDKERKREREKCSQGFPNHTKEGIILGTFLTMCGVLLTPLSNETLDSEKHPRKTHAFGEKNRARI